MNQILWRVKEKVESSWIWKYGLLYFGIFSGVAVIFGLIIFQSYSGILKNQIKNNAFLKGENIQLSINYNIRNILLNSLDILADAELLKIENGDSLLRDMKIQDSLKRFVKAESSDYIQYLYNADAGRLYSTTNVINVENSNNKFRVNNMDVRAYLNSISGSKNIEIFPEAELDYNMDSGKYVVLTVKNQTSNRKQKNRMVVTFLKRDVFFENFDKDRLIVLNENNTVLLHNLDIATENVEKLSQEIMKDGIKPHARVLDKYYPTVISAQDTNLKYLLLFDEGELFGMISLIRNIFIGYLLIIFLVSGVSVFFVIKKQYAPISDITNYIENEYEKKDLHGKTELEVIKNVLEQNVYICKEYINKFEMNRTAIREYMLSRLIKGEFESIAEFNEEALEVGMEFHSSEFCIAVFVGDHITFQRPADLDELSEHGYFKKILENDMLFYVMEYFEGWQDELVRIKQEMQRLFGDSITLGVGTFRKIDELFYSYLEARNAYNSRVLRDKGEIIYAGAEQEQEKIRLDSDEKLNYLFSCIEACDNKKMEEAVDELLRDIKKKNIERFDMNILLYDIIIRFMKIKEKIENEQHDFSMDINFANNLLKLNSIKELEYFIKTFAGKMIEKLKCRDIQVNSLITEITSRIEANFCEPDFSIMKLADEFHMSYANFSRYFKAKKGINIKDYISILEIERSKDLLLNTDISIKEIAGMVGQCDVSNYIRKFKKKVGITPGEYRERHKI